MCSLFNFDHDNIADINSPIRPIEEFSQRDLRALVFHLLYAMEAFDYQESLAAIVDNFNRGFGLTIPADSDVVKTVQAIVDERMALDEAYKPLLTNWRFERVGLCTKLILRYAIWELKNTDTDSRIIINEAVELAKCFAEADAYRFINGILDTFVKELLPHRDTIKLVL